MDTALYFLLLSVIAATQARVLPVINASPENPTQQHLGDTIDLSTANLFSSNVWSKSPYGSIFESILPSDCIYSDSSTNFVNTGYYYASSTELIDMMAKSTNLEVGAWGATLKSSSSYSFITNTKEDVTAFRADWKQPSREFSINPKCLKAKALDPYFEAAWRNLTVDPKSPCWSRPEGCQSFYSFARKWGTHILTSWIVGSRLQVFASAVSSYRYSSKALATELCAGFEAGQGGFQACNNVNTNTSNKDIKVNIQFQQVRSYS